MFEKKKKRITLLDNLPESYEDVSLDEKRRNHANRIYSIDNDKMRSINPVGVVRDIDTGEFVVVISLSYLKQEVFMNKIKLFIDNNAEKAPQTLPDELIVKHDNKEEDKEE